MKLNGEECSRMQVCFMKKPTQEATVDFASKLYNLRKFNALKSLGVTISNRFEVQLTHSECSVWSKWYI